MQTAPIPTIEQLNAELDQLRNEIEELRVSLARELRTERLVIVHPVDGRELITTRVLGDSVSLNVEWMRDVASVALSSGYDDSVTDLGVDAGDNANVSLILGGAVVAGLDANAGRAHSIEVTSQLRLEQQSWAADGSTRLRPDRAVTLDALDGLRTER